MYAFFWAQNFGFWFKNPIFAIRPQFWSMIIILIIWGPYGIQKQNMRQYVIQVVLFKDNMRGPRLKKISVAVGYLVALNSAVDIFQPRV